MNAFQIIDLLKLTKLDLPTLLHILLNKTVDLNFQLDEKIKNYEVVSEYGGEGMGETWYAVLYFKDHNVYLKFDGYYTSYSGLEIDWEEIYEVFPQIKTYTAYEPIK